MASKFYSFLQQQWKDPVWSKLIAGGIGVLLTPFAAVFYAWWTSVVRKIPFSDALNVIVALTWWKVLAVLSSICILSFGIKPAIRLWKTFYRKTDPITTAEEGAGVATEHSTVVFTYRVAQAFPGVRGLEWFNDPVLATDRLAILLKMPIKFKSGTMEHSSDPVWWFRGGSALFIERFQRTGRRTILLNFDQLRIRRIAVSHGPMYYKDFVYVEAEGEKQTGLYKYSKEDIARHLRSFGYSNEEYGLFKGKPITREEYDDGATVTRGKVVDTDGAELRIRYLSSYNIIITSKGSPYNSRRFNRESLHYFNGILAGTIEPQDFFSYLETYEKNER